MRYKWISFPCKVYSYHQSTTMYVGDKKQSDSGDLGYDLKVFPILTNGIDIYPAALGKTCNHCMYTSRFPPHNYSPKYYFMTSTS